jgi:APA family basic amino acid/polyamine antiporter
MTTALKKQIGLYGLTMIAVGSSIGSGIFITPSDIASLLGSGYEIILVWVIGGVVALTGALTFAELGALFPKAGGIYVYIREAYGSLLAFLYGWTILTVITSGAIAALSIAFARYVSVLVPLDQRGIQIVAFTAIVVVTGINVIGVKIAELFSSVFTTLKLVGILAVVCVGITLGNYLSVDAQNIGLTMSGNSTFALALIGVLWSYGGWHHASYLSAETKNATRTVPRAMIIGAIIITVMYVTTNLAYLSLLPIDQISTSRAVASDALMQVLPSGAILIAVLIAISTFGTAGIYTLSAPRIYFAMSRDKCFFKGLSRIHPRFKTPVNAVLVQSGWSIILLFFWGTFERLITYVVFMDWIFLTLSAMSIFIFRRKMKDRDQSLYKTNFYPIVPLIFIGISSWFIIHTMIGRPEQAIAGLILLGIGLPVYFYFRKVEKDSNPGG